MLGYVAFIVAHVTLVVMTGFLRNMNHIVLGTDDLRPIGVILGFMGIAVVVLSWIAAHYVSWTFPRRLQHLQRTISLPMLLLTFNRLSPSQRYRDDQISPHFWPNGKMPEGEDWKRLAVDRFRGYRLQVGGLVDRPVRSRFRISKRSASKSSSPCTTASRAGRALPGGEACRVLFLWRRPLRRPLLRHTDLGECGQAGMPSRTRDERRTAPGRLRRPAPPACREPTRLQDGEMDRADEFIESEQHVGKGEGGKNEDDEDLDLLPEYLSGSARISRRRGLRYDAICLIPPGTKYASGEPLRRGTPARPIRCWLR